MQRPLGDWVPISFLKGRKGNSVSALVCQISGGVFMLMGTLAIQTTDSARIGVWCPALHQSKCQAKERSECLLTFSPLRKSRF